MGAARGDGERHAPEGEELEGEIRHGGEHLQDGRGRQLRRQADVLSPARGERARRCGIVNIDERADGMRPVPEKAERRQVVRLDRMLAVADEVAHMPALALQRYHGEGRERHPLARRLQPLDHLGDVRLAEMLALGTDRLAERDMLDGRLVGDAEIEIPPFRPVPEEIDRPQAEGRFARRRHVVSYRQRLS